MVEILIMLDIPGITKALTELAIETLKILILLTWLRQNTKEKK